MGVLRKLFVYQILKLYLSNIIESLSHIENKRTISSPKPSVKKSNTKTRKLHLSGKYLLLTNTVSCGLMMGFGDVLQQRSEHWRQHNRNNSYFPQDGKSIKPADSNSKKDTIKTFTLADIDECNTEYQHDYIRTKNMIIVGVAQGPFHHYFYAFLDRTLPGKDAVSIAKKTLVDQLVASPVCLAIFFFGLGALEQRRLQDIQDEVKLKFTDTMKVDISLHATLKSLMKISDLSILEVDWCFWPPIQCVNFLLVPIRFRVVYINLMTMIYDIFLSYVKYDAQYD